MKVDPSSHTLYSSKLIKELNAYTKTLKLLEESIGVNFWGWQWFLRYNTKSTGSKKQTGLNPN
jgi:hypothetical protein